LEQQESPAVQCRHFFCISRTLAIFDSGKQRAIRANYFAAKKSASRDKIRKWKTGFRNNKNRKNVKF
jgi:hypothetical protein